MLPKPTKTEVTMILVGFCMMVVGAVGLYHILQRICS